MGILFLSNPANTFNGTTTINAGVLEYAAAGSIGGTAGTPGSMGRSNRFYPLLTVRIPLPSSHARR